MNSADPKDYFCLKSLENGKACSKRGYHYVTLHTTIGIASTVFCKNHYEEYENQIENYVTIVTVKLPVSKKHDPTNKKILKCPIFTNYITGASGQEGTCTDATGEHHSKIMYGKSIESIRQNAEEVFGHVTRIEVLGKVSNARVR